jgi:hypothetical protein
MLYLHQDWEPPAIVTSSIKSNSLIWDWWFTLYFHKIILKKKNYCWFKIRWLKFWSYLIRVDRVGCLAVVLRPVPVNGRRLCRSVKRRFSESKNNVHFSPLNDILSPTLGQRLLMEVIIGYRKTTEEPWRCQQGWTWTQIFSEAKSFRYYRIFFFILIIQLNNKQYMILLPIQHL